jgi:hypothetical protein
MVVQLVAEVATVHPAVLRQQRHYKEIMAVVQTAASVEVVEVEQVKLVVMVV